MTEALEFLSRAVFEIYFEEQMQNCGCDVKGANPEEYPKDSHTPKKGLQSSFGVCSKHQEELNENLRTKWLNSMPSEGAVVSSNSNRSAEGLTHEQSGCSMPDLTHIMSLSLISDSSTLLMREQIEHGVHNEITTFGARDIRGIDIPKRNRPKAISFEQAMSLARLISSFAKRMVSRRWPRYDSSDVKGDSECLIFLMNMGLIGVTQGPNCGTSVLASSFSTRLKALYKLGDITIDRAMAPPTGTKCFISKTDNVRLYVHDKFIAKVMLDSRDIDSRTGNNIDSGVRIEWVRGFDGKANFDAGKLWKQNSSPILWIKGVRVGVTSFKLHVAIQSIDNRNKVAARIIGMDDYFPVAWSGKHMLYFESKDPLLLYEDDATKIVKAKQNDTNAVYAELLEGLNTAVIREARYSKSNENDAKGTGFYVGAVKVPPNETVESINSVFASFSSIFATIETTLVRRVRSVLGVPIVEPLLILVVKAEGNARILNNIVANALHFACCELLANAIESGYGFESQEVKRVLRMYRMSRCISRAIFELYSLSDSLNDPKFSPEKFLGPCHYAKVRDMDEKYWRQWLRKEGVHLFKKSRPVPYLFGSSSSSSSTTKLGSSDDESLSFFREQVSHCIANALQQQQKQWVGNPGRSSGVSRRNKLFDKSLNGRGGNDEGKTDEGDAASVAGPSRSKVAEREALILALPQKYSLNGIKMNEAVSLAATITRLARTSSYYLHEPLDKDLGSGILLVVDMGLIGVEKQENIGITRLAVSFPVRLRASCCIGWIALERAVPPPQATEHWLDKKSRTSLYVHPAFVAKVVIVINKDSDFARVEWVHSLGGTMKFTVNTGMEKQDTIYPIGGTSATDSVKECS